MAAGDRADQLARLKQVLPPWFPDESPILDAVLTGIATSLAFIYAMIGAAALQTRIKSATGIWLDLIANDFFGIDAVRSAGQSDNSFRNVILVNLFRERATRAGMSRVLLDLTGYSPLIFEPARVQDTGAYGAPSAGYGAAGAYGSMLLPYQAFITASRPLGTGIPNVAGYGVSTGGYSTPSRAEWASLDMIQDSIRDSDIYAAVDGVKAAGTIMWTRITNGSPIAPPLPNFSLILASGAVRFGPTGKPIRLLGWQL